MVQNKKQFQSGKKSMSQDLDKKSQAGAADRTDRATDTSRQGSMKQTDLKEKPGISKRDVGSRK